MVASVRGKPAEVVATSRRDKKQAPPLPYNLSALQIDAAKAFGLSAKQVLDTCQTLYERHKLLTYPRSDNRYLPSQYFTQNKFIKEAMQDIENTNLSSMVYCPKMNISHSIAPIKPYPLNY